MMRRRVAVVGVLLLAACLSDPDASGGNDAAPADGAGSARDASPNIDATPVGPGTAFPPVGVEVAIERGVVADLNGDGTDDLVLASRTGFPDSNGVYVLLGQPGVGVPDYHEYFATGAGEPVAVTAGAFGDGTGLDVLALVVDYGEPADEFDNDTFVHAYARRGDGRYETDAYVRDIGVGTGCALPRFEDQPAALELGRFVADQPLPAVAVGHDHGLCLVQPQAFSSVAWSMAERTAIDVDRSTTALRAIPSAMAELDDLLAPSLVLARWYRNDGAGGFVIAEQNTAAGMERAAFFDVDGTPPLDMVGFRQVGLLAHAVATAGSDQALPWRGEVNLAGFPGGLNDIAVVEADGAADPRPEILLASNGCDDAVPGGSPCIAMLRNVYASGAELDSDAAQTTASLDAAFRPAHLFVGDFDGDDLDEILAWSADGRSQCLRATGALLLPCE